MLTAQEEIAALGHTEETIPGKDATCTETGLTAGVKCSVCDEILTAQEEIAALGHTESELAAEEATCGKPGKTAGVECSVCHAVLTAQEEIPATGKHEYDDEGNCTICSAACPVIKVEGNKVVVDENGTKVGQMHIFYLGDKTVNSSNWSTVKAAAVNVDNSPYGANGYIVRNGVVAMNSVELAANGNYVLFVNFVDAAGQTKSVSVAVTVEVMPGVTLGEDGKVEIDLNGYGAYRAYVFYLVDAEGVATGIWSQVKAAAAADAELSPYGATGFQTYWEGSKYYALDMCYLPETAGTYVVFVSYYDENGEIKQISETFVVE